VEEQNEPDIVWCRSVVEQLDSAASACVVEISELEAECADDFAWMQSPRVRVRIFVSSTPRLLALVAGAAPSLRLEEIRIFLCFAPSLSMLRGYNLASVTRLSAIDCTELISLEGLADSQLHQLQSLSVSDCPALASLQGLEGARLGSLTALFIEA